MNQPPRWTYWTTGRAAIAVLIVAGCLLSWLIFMSIATLLYSTGSPQAAGDAGFLTILGTFMPAFGPGLIWNLRRTRIWLVITAVALVCASGLSLLVV